MRRQRSRRGIFLKGFLILFAGVFAGSFLSHESMTEEKSGQLTAQTVEARERAEDNGEDTASARENAADTGESEEIKADLAAKRAREILDGMTLEEKAGQMFVARCPAEDAVGKAAACHLGGYILFGRDLSEKTREEVIQNITSYKEAAEIPLFIGVDEEGGTVNRVSKNPNLRAAPFWSPQKLYREGGFGLVRSDTKEKCDLLRSLGINLNMAPVCDVSQDSKDFIYRRSFGQDAEQTARYVQTVVEVMNEENMGSVLKHFPGYGNNVDTHTGMAYDERSYETFQTADFLPFQSGIDSGADMVLVSHNIVKCMDEQYPASLSPKVHEILRTELHFSGIIMTDDLAMDAVEDFVPRDRAAVLAVQAGNDIVCCSDFEVQMQAVLKAVQNGEITEERIDESVLRILTCKILRGILL